MSTQQKNPTNKDIVQLITLNHEEVQTRLLKVEEQVKLTNGRVKKLETIQERADAVEEYKKTQGAQSGSDPKVSWDWKMVLAILLTLATIFAGVKANG